MSAKEEIRIHDKGQIDISFNHVRENLKNVDNRLNKIMSKLDNHMELINERVIVTEMDKIENLLKCLPTIPDIENWKKKLQNDNLDF